MGIPSIMRVLVALCLVFGCSAKPADFLSHVGLPAIVQSKVADGDDTMPADVTKLSVSQLGLPLTYLHGIPSFSVPAVVTAEEESEDSDETTTAVHAIPYFGAAAVPVLSTVDIETKKVGTVDAAVPADTTKLTITTEEQEIPAIKYVQPFGNALPYTNFPFANFPYNNFGYNNFGYNFGYNYYNPLPSSHAGYPYHFGYP